LNFNNQTTSPPLISNLYLPTELKFSLICYSRANGNPEKRNAIPAVSETPWIPHQVRNDKTDTITTSSNLPYSPFVPFEKGELGRHPLTPPALPLLRGDEGGLLFFFNHTTSKFTDWLQIRKKVLKFMNLEEPCHPMKPPPQNTNKKAKLTKGLSFGSSAIFYY
jgi:hypothetical protein